jgi:pimeloyl-ACP methyl ester carboxylesterase
MTLPPLHTTEIQGRVQAWREAGAPKPDVPALVLLHGIGGGSESWRHQYGYFSEHFRVIGWDMPGYGGSDGLKDPAPSVDLYAAALADLLEELGVGRAHVLGQSVAALIAARFCRMQDARAASFIFAHGLTGLAHLPEDERVRLRAARLAIFEAMGPERFAHEKGPAIMSIHAPVAAIEEAVAIMARVKATGFRQAVEMLASGNIFADIPSITVPGLVLCGADDPVSPEPVCRQVEGALSHAEYRVLADAGHYAAIETPLSFNRALSDFLNRSSD